MAMMLKMVIHRDLCCGDCALCYRSTCGIKGKEKEFCLALEPEGNMGFPRFRVFSAAFPHPLLSHQPLKKPQDLGS